MTMVAMVGLLTFFGSATIANVLAAWSVLLYLAYGALFVLIFKDARGIIDHHLSTAAVTSDWALAGLRYASYNLAIPSVLFCVTLLTSRRQSLAAGAMTGVLAIVPALAFFIAMLSRYPEIMQAPVPVLMLMASLQAPLLEGLFYLVVFGTFVETGTGLLHAINERIDGQVSEGGHVLPRWARPAIATALLLGSVYGATQIGIIDLIAQGYGALSWGYLIVLVIPLMTIGLTRIVTSSSSGNP